MHFLLRLAVARYFASEKHPLHGEEIMIIKRGIVRAIVFSLLAVSLGLVYEAKAEENLKIGYIDISAVFNRYAKTQELEKNLEKEKQTKQKTIDKKLEEIKKLVKELKTKAPGLKEEERQRRSEVIEKKKKEHFQFAQQSELEIRNWIMEQQREIMKVILETVRSYGKENGYTLILDGTKGPMGEGLSSVLYGLKELDLTDQIINLLNTAEGTASGGISPRKSRKKK